ncbi:hypothetical protein EMIHUDRAFT_458652 [Emiliania huxleyi CCMP1516]|uniref:Uncharacterized protein n=2 Tax=Emiliania huxleyi TaxID=2903 RepID=A0A0D3J8N0_EMIH1|nr:hypothetical protein EMIHUDRAFT_458652 [Emiliania huxleyi CCMP1516]EOD19865.1 hypothetical protein EMIHUDRAFT_458652 [Emiliania huxleyi CCMP1516]|eukprot:XP_005772294.1 hypothetical protein EMIHUDRAFT_458652 [Emiliania huxleyi CCMP1516]
MMLALGSPSFGCIVTADAGIIAGYRIVTTMIAALSFATNGFASAPTTPDSCPPESMDLLVYLNAQSSAVDFMTNVLHMADHTTPAATVMAEMMTNFKPIGSHTQHICEATDILYADPAMDPVDGQSGDVNYPYGDIKVLLTVGEYLPSNGYMLVGVPDGMGAMLKDDSTVRIVFQSESYGPMYYESYPFIVNPDGASFTGSHVMYVDYDRDSLAEFMSNGRSAEGMVKDAGNLIESVYNLKARRSASTLRLARHASHRWGNLVEQRSEDGCTTHPHYSNTDPEGCGMWENIMNTGTPTDADWLMQSLCSAHLAELVHTAPRVAPPAKPSLSAVELVELAGPAKISGTNEAGCRSRSVLAKVDASTGDAIVRCEQSTASAVDVEATDPDATLTAAILTVAQLALQNLDVTICAKRYISAAWERWRSEAKPARGGGTTCHGYRRLDPTIASGG